MADIAFGHRLMMDCVVPGGIAADVAPGGPDAVLGALADLAHGMAKLERLYTGGLVSPDFSASASSAPRRSTPLGSVA